MHFHLRKLTALHCLEQARRGNPFVCVKSNWKKFNSEWLTYTHITQPDREHMTSMHQCDSWCHILSVIDIGYTSTNRMCMWHVCRIDLRTYQCHLRGWILWSPYFCYYRYIDTYEMSIKNVLNFCTMWSILFFNSPKSTLLTRNLCFPVIVVLWGHLKHSQLSQGEVSTSI